MKQIHFYWTFLLLSISASISDAQSLSELLSVAIDSNLEIRILNNEYLASRERGAQVSQLADPVVGVGYFPMPVETRLGAQTLRLSASQNFPWFGKLENEKALEDVKAEAMFERMGVRALDLLWEIKRAYFRIYEIDNKQVILAENIEVLKSLERLALAKVESGKASTADVLRVQLRITELSKEIELLEKDRIEPTVTINRILNRELETAVIANDTFSFAQIHHSKDSLKARVGDNHPLLRMLELQQEVDRQAIIANQLSGKASFGVGADYIFVSERDDASPVNNGRDILQLRASVKIPIYRKKYAAKEQEEYLKIAAIEDHKKNALLKFNEIIERAYAAYEIAALKASLYKEQIRIINSAIAIIQSDYSASGDKFEELLRLEMELIGYKLKMLEVTMESQTAKSDIDKLLLI